MNNINLLEKNYEDLYDWKTLFNKSRPISSYIKINDKRTVLNDYFLKNLIFNEKTSVKRIFYYKTII